MDLNSLTAMLNRSCRRHRPGFGWNSLLCTALGLFLAPGSGFAEPAEEAGESWYQIEVLVFANQKNIEDDEQWPTLERSYPAQMLFIGPVTGDDLSPLNLGQLKQVDAYQQLLSAAAAAPAVNSAATDTEFLFQSMSRKQPTYTGQGLSEEDLLAGITREAVPIAPAEAPTESMPVAEELVSSTRNEVHTGDLGYLFNQDSRVEAYRDLPDDQLNLSAVSRRIDLSSQYKLLYHAAWRQQILSMGDAIPILLQGGEQYDSLFELDGYVTISKSRYLHLDTQLWYTQFVPRSGQSTIVMPDNTQFYSAEDRALLQKYPRVQHYEAMRDNYLPTATYPMIQSRKLKTAALHYLDHPAFGLLIRVEEYQPPPPVADW